MKFTSATTACIFDGLHTLYLVELERPLNTDDPLEPEKWNVTFRCEENCTASLLKDAVKFENKCHLLLVNIQEKNKKFETLIHWLELTGGPTWFLSRKRMLNCYEAVPEYLSLETNGQSVYVAGPSFIEFVYDSEKSVVSQGMKRDAAPSSENDVKFKREKFYSWSQTSEEINLTVNLNSAGCAPIDTSSILVYFNKLTAY